MGHSNNQKQQHAAYIIVRTGGYDASLPLSGIDTAPRTTSTGSKHVLQLYACVPHELLRAPCIMTGFSAQCQDRNRSPTPTPRRGYCIGDGSIFFICTRSKVPTHADNTGGGIAHGQGRCEYFDSVIAPRSHQSILHAVAHNRCHFNADWEEGIGQGRECSRDNTCMILLYSHWPFRPHPSGIMGGLMSDMYAECSTRIDMIVPALLRTPD